MASNDELEPKVNAADVARVLRRVILPDDEDAGESVAIIAERAETSTRTVYRVLRAGDSPLSLSLADRLLVAAGGHISECELIWPAGAEPPVD